MSEMTANQRRQAVKALLDGDPSLSQRAIAKRLGVSQASVRRDMAALGLASVHQPFVRQQVSLALAQLNGGKAGGDSLGAEGIAALMACYVTAGDKLVAEIRAELDGKGLEPDAREEGLLAEIRATADLIAAAQKRIDADGLVFAPARKGGPPRAHPLLSEIRGQRAVLARLLSQISLEEGTKNPVKVKAANARWQTRRMQREAGIG